MTGWKKLREGHWVSANGYEILRDTKKWFLYDPDGVPVVVEGDCAWASLRRAQRAFLSVESDSAMAAKNVNLA
jgi:hypothetical protein